MLTSTVWTAWCGPACLVVWEGGVKNAPRPDLVETLLFRFDLGAFLFDFMYITHICQVCLNKSAIATNIFIQFDS